MQKQHANIDFSKVIQADLSPLARKIASLLTLNAPIFPALPVTMAVFTPLVTTWDGVIAKPDYPGKTGDLINARAAIEKALSTNGKYINNIANGDMAILGKSGYPISKAYSPVGDLLPPAAVTVTSGSAEGSFDVDVTVVDNAKGYLFAFTPITNTETDPKDWTIRWMPTHTLTFDDFTSGTKYKFAAAGVGTSANVFWTNAKASLFAQ